MGDDVAIHAAFTLPYIYSTLRQQLRALLLQRRRKHPNSFKNAPYFEVR